MTWLYAGWGFRSTASPESFSSCWQQACMLQPQLERWPGVLCFSVLSHKAPTAAGKALRGWAEANFTLPQWFDCTESDIRQTKTISTSSRLLQRFGTGSVSEALALQAALSHSAHRCSPPLPPRLLLPRIVSADRKATLAIATISAPEQTPPILKTGVFS